jgi:hypothetical protein
MRATAENPRVAVLMGASSPDVGDFATFGATLAVIAGRYLNHGHGAARDAIYARPEATSLVAVSRAQGNRRCGGRHRVIDRSLGAGHLGKLTGVPSQYHILFHCCLLTLRPRPVMSVWSIALDCSRGTP